MSAIFQSSSNPQEITEALYKVEFDGALGRTKINERGVAEKLERIFVVNDSRPVLVEQIMESGVRCQIAS